MSVRFFGATSLYKTHGLRNISPEYDYLFKLQLIGDSGVGKSSTILRFCEHTFTENFISTLGVDFKIRQIDRFKLQLWDSAGGQERIRTIISQYGRSIHAQLIMFDVTNQETFSNVQKWLQEVDRVTNENTPKFLVGNKTDLINERKVPTEDAKEFADQLSLPYIEISAKDGTNVEELFGYIANFLKERVEDDKSQKSFEEYINDLEEKQKPMRSNTSGGGCTIS